MVTRINGRNEIIVHLEILAKEMQKQARRQWIFSICIAAATFLVGIAAIITAILG